MYEAWASELNKQNGLALTYMQCQNCWMKMKKKAKQVKWMLDHSGASFNVETGRILASDDLWAALEANFGAEGRWMKSRPYVLGNSDAKDLLDEILGAEKATGSQMRTAEESQNGQSERRNRQRKRRPSQRLGGRRGRKTKQCGQTLT